MNRSSTDSTNDVQRAGVAKFPNVDERYNEDHLKRVKKGLGIVAKDLCRRPDPCSRVILFVLMEVRARHT